VRRGETNAVDAVEARDEVDQRGEVGGAAAVHDAAIGVHVLAEQVDLAHAELGEPVRLRDHVVEWAADLFTARVRHHAVRAVLAAAFHHRQESRAARALRFGNLVELLDLGERDVDDVGHARTHLGDHRGQPVERLGAEHEIHERRALQQRGALLARNAAADADEEVRAFFLQLAPAAEQREHFFLRFVAHGAGVEQQNVRVLGRLACVRIQ
jgi:hypothetical protein